MGRNKTLIGDVDGGTGTLVLINSNLTATDIVIGSNGFLGGTGKITGNLVNHGIFAPGQSPGVGAGPNVLSFGRFQNADEIAAALA